MPGINERTRIQGANDWFKKAETRHAPQFPALFGITRPAVSTEGIKLQVINPVGINDPLDGLATPIQM